MYSWVINKEKYQIAIASLKNLAKQAGKEFVEVEEEVKAEYLLLGGLLRKNTEKEISEANTETVEEAEAKQAHKTVEPKEE